MRLVIAQTWDAQPIDESEQVVVTLARRRDDLVVEVDAPYHGDPRPTVAPGRLDRLWEYEVVELFLAGADERYLELEVGPHGHYLVLQLAGRRHVERRALLAQFEAVLSGHRWRGTARLPVAYLPPDVVRGNAYAMHDVGPNRRYLAAFPVPGERPDFHALDRFGPVEI
jgi:hypothetical protein